MGENGRRQPISGSDAEWSPRRTRRSRGEAEVMFHVGRLITDLPCPFSLLGASEMGMLGTSFA